MTFIRGVYSLMQQEMGPHSITVHSFSIVQKAADQDDGSVALFGPFSSMTLESRLEDGPAWVLFVELSGLYQPEYDVTVTVQRPGGDEPDKPFLRVTGRVRTINAHKDQAGTFRVSIPSLPYPIEGPYTVSLFLNGNKIASRALRVAFRKK